jgi:hypothetical protein
MATIFAKTWHAVTFERSVRFVVDWAVVGFKFIYKEEGESFNLKDKYSHLLDKDISLHPNVEKKIRMVLDSKFNIQYSYNSFKKQIKTYAIHITITRSNCSTKCTDYTC